MKILVTGAAGFIGSHTCEKLLQKNHQVYGLDNFDEYYSPLIKEQNANILKGFFDFEMFRIDIRDSNAVSKIFNENKFDLVIHLAAKAGVRPSILEAKEYMDVNILGLTNLLEASRKNGVPRFIFASSSSVYGNQKKTPFAETDDVSFQISPYAASKRSGELLCHVYHHLYGIEIACLRLFTVYGPRQRPDLAIHKFTQLALNGKPIELFGNGDTKRDYTFVSDIVDGIIAISQHPILTYEIFNIGNGNPIQLTDMIHALQKAINLPIEIIYTSKQSGDVDQTHADIMKAKSHFGFQAQVSLEQGVRRFVEWYINSPKI